MTTDTVGGVWSYAMELLRALAPYPCEMLLATMSAPLSPSQRRAAAQIANLTLAESSYKLEWMDDPWAHVDASGAWLMELARDFRPDLVHLNTYAHGALPWKVPVLMVGHSCVLSWWQAVKGEAAPQSWATYQRRVQAGLLKADMVVAPTRAMMHELNTYYGPFHASQIIYNARRSADFTPGVKENFIFTMGRAWDEAKNIAILDQIADQVPWPVYVAGEQQHPGGGKVELAHLHSLGHLSQDEISNWLARASIFVMPARYEPFGLAVLEAALSGCALVLGDILSLRELWDEAAIFAPPDDALMLKHCLCYLTGAATRRESLGEAARVRAGRYAPDRMGRAYWSVYQSLVTQVPVGVVSHPRNGNAFTAGHREWPVWVQKRSGRGGEMGYTS
jgi:glycosyltransferase involved in cell wall biosynthesis